MGVIAEGIPRGGRVYSPPCPWDTHYQFSIKTLLSKLETLSCHVSVKRDVRTLSFELSNSIRKCHPKWDWLYQKKKVDYSLETQSFQLLSTEDTFSAGKGGGQPR